MKKWTFIFLFVLNISGACALFPVSSSSIVATEQPQHKVIRIDDITKTEIQKKFPWITDRLYYIIEKESAKYEEVNPMLVSSLMWKESRGKRLARSHAGAIGYMQVMSFHYSGKRNDLYKPEINIKVGVRELATCFRRKRFRSDIGALKCYNAGPNHKKYTNWKYVREITNNYDDLSNKVMDKVMVYIDSGYEVI